MLPGQVEAGHKGAFEVAWLPKGSAGRYEKITQDGRDVVQLRCEDCHESLDRSDSSLATSITNAAGRFYQPVSFEKHCADCHRLNFAGQKSEDLPLPHYATREVFKKLLTLNFRTKAVDGQVAMPADKALSQTELKSLPASNLPLQLHDSVIEKAVDAVFERCLQCHAAEDMVEHSERTAPENKSALDLALAGQRQALIPDRWLQYGSFDHAAHSNISCEYCHPGTRGRDEITNAQINKLRQTVPGSLSNAVDQQIVKINSISSCMPCHRPNHMPDDESLKDPKERVRLLGKSKQPIRASDDCTLCHRYHWTRPAVQPPVDLVSP